MQTFTFSKRVTRVMVQIIYVACCSFSLFAAEAGENLIPDPGFDRGPGNWRLSPKGEFVENVGHTRPGCLYISNDEKGKSFLVSLSVNSLQGNRLYVFTAWAKNNRVSGTGSILKIELYDGEGKCLKEDQEWTRQSPVAGVWNKMTVTIRARTGIVSAKLLLRQSGEGESHFDDLDFHEEKLFPYEMQIQPWTTYQGLGNTNVAVNFTYNDVIKESSFRYFVHVKDESGKEVVRSESIPVTGKLTRVEFPISLSQAGKWKVETGIIDSSGTENSRTNEPFYIYNRPAMLAKGFIEKEGKPFFPIGIYHLSTTKFEEEIPFLAAAGFNSVQGKTMADHVRLKRVFDVCRKYNIQVGQVLYNSFKANVDAPMAINTAKAFVDEPNIFSQWFWDEPHVHGIDIRDMMDLRHEVGKIDGNRPSYVVLASDMETEHWGTDIIAVDPYPKRRQPTPITVYRDEIRLARKLGKSCIAVVQAFEELPNWFQPAPQELENYVYQALMNGAIGVFYYALSDPNWYLPTSKIWEKTQSLNKEMAFLAPIILDSVTREIIFKTAPQTDIDFFQTQVEGKTYLFAMNVQDKADKLSVPVGGSYKKAEPLFGRGTPKIGNGKLVDDIEAYGTRVYILE